MRVLRPAEGVLAFYDGRVDGYRFAEGLNWVDEPALRATPLRELIGGPLEARWIHYYEAYEAVHKENLESVLRESPP